MVFFKNNFINNIEEINSLNQRGGRMLSIIDLLKRNTLDIETACFLINEVQNGSSVLIVAKPGAAGKTTLMGALLGVLPSNTNIFTYSNSFYRNSQFKHPNSCIIAHEIGKGNWHGYIWGNEVKNYVQLKNRGFKKQVKIQLITNMHQDNPESILKTFQSFGISKSIFNQTFDIIIKIKYIHDYSNFNNNKNELRVIEKIWKTSPNSWKNIFNTQFRDGSALETLENKNLDNNFDQNLEIKFIFNRNGLSQEELNDYNIKKQKIVKKIEFCLEKNITLIEDVMKIFNSNTS